MEERDTDILERRMTLGTVACSVGKSPLILPVIEAELARLSDVRAIERIWARDHTLWKPAPTEITDRLGWLDSAGAMRGEVRRLRDFASEIWDAGLRRVLLLGMGGSSLAPDMFAQTLSGDELPCMPVEILDSTHPMAVLEAAQRHPPESSLYIVSTKSGTTIETLSLFKYFYTLAVKALGPSQAGARFAAITDPGSRLEELARRCGFRAIFLADPEIGGRYSAISHFGLVPAALAGADVSRMLNRVEELASACRPNVPIERNAGAIVGATAGALARAGRDKITFIVSPALASFGGWVEQLVAESTGKEGVGILPVVGEPLCEPEGYRQDRLFVHMRLAGDDDADAGVEALIKARQPILRMDLGDRYDLAGQLFLWEMATAVACVSLGVNPFDQPNVESAKKTARTMLERYVQTGSLPAPTPLVREGDLSVFGVVRASSLQRALSSFLFRPPSNGYVALHAYLHPSPETDAALGELRAALWKGTGLATTVGYGPRFLHSTGQLHKGDAGRGLFIQLTADHSTDAPIPDEAGQDASSTSFGVLLQSQVLGDYQALLAAGRRVIRFHLGSSVEEGLRQLVSALG